MNWIFLLAATFSCLSTFHCFTGYESVANPLSDEDNVKLQQTCGVPPVTRSRRSINSEHVDRSKAPWVVSMIHNYRRWTPRMNESDVAFHSDQYCSGTLISNRHVMVAAHCLKEVNNIDRVRFVINKRFGEIKDRRYTEDFISIHKTARVYISNTYEKDATLLLHHGDMAVVELTTNVTLKEDVWPVCLGDYFPLPGDKLDEYGYGMDDTYARIGNLQHIPTSVITHEDCLTAKQKTVQEYKLIDLICTARKYQHTCSGDSGSGFIANHKGRRVVVSALSSGYPCAYQTQLYKMGMDIFPDMSVAVAAHISWICEATGICANSDVIEDVKTWKGLPNRMIERFNTVVPPKIDEMYLVKKV